MMNEDVPKVFGAFFVYVQLSGKRGVMKMSELINVEEIFASKVFTRSTMRERLTRNIYKEVVNVMDNGGELSPAAADVVAKAMKDWAVENGATHYTHWFQPLTGITAEKHDSFVSHPDENGKMLMYLN